ncbi:hypothetical protein [Paraburkholderia sp. RL17-337-BIB-A]|uniref:hypothetical protein n=1 Tax=Paraburkholderia sp. RL17-337-BIB-A TaxID=3031636 RepID=UPI0038B7DD3F
MLIKVTLNEATDPDLFAYLSQFDNARLRAGAFRALASATARGDRARPDVAVHTRGAAQVTMPLAGPTSRSRVVDEPHAEHQTFIPPPPAATTWTEPPPVVSDPRSHADPTHAHKRFDTDAIGEQFADF